MEASASTNPKVASTGAHAPARAVPFMARMLRPALTALFLICYAALEIVCRVAVVTSVTIPSALLPGYARRFHRPLWNALIRFWARGTWALARGLMRLRLEARGDVPEGRFLVVANHQSTVDILVLFHLFDGKNLKFLVKRDLLRSGSIVATALSQGGFGVVDFDDGRGTIARLLGFCRDLRSWEGTAVIFPEGARSA